MSNNRYPNVQKGSFRGAQFETFDAEVLFGRRNVLHEYPLKDEPFAEDLGKKAREYTFNCYVIGDNLYAARDALMRAIEEDDTPGTLVHPTLGSILVIPKECRTQFNNKEGGLEYFTLTFVEAGSQSYPSGGIDTSFFSSLFASDAITSIISYFASTFVTKNLPDFLHDDAVNNLVGNPLNVSSGNNGSFTSTIETILKNGNFGSANDDYTNLSELKTKFIASATTDVDTPSTLGDKVSAMITSLADVFINQPTQTNDIDNYTFLVIPNYNYITALEAQKRLMTFGDNYPDLPTSTDLRLQQIVNREQLLNLIQHCALCEMIRITASMTFPSRQDAILVRDTVDSFISPRLETLANAGADEPYIAINKARAAMIKDINTRAANLKNKVYVSTFDPMPVIVFAYDKYEDATQDADIIRRNNIRNPVFIPPNSTLEIVV